MEEKILMEEKYNNNKNIKIIKKISYGRIMCGARLPQPSRTSPYRLREENALPL